MFVPRSRILLHRLRNNPNSVQSQHKHTNFNLDCMLLSCHVQVSEWIHNLWFAWMSRNSFLARSKRHIWSLRDSNGTRTHNHLVRERTLSVSTLDASTLFHSVHGYIWMNCIICSDIIFNVFESALPVRICLSIL